MVELKQLLREQGGWSLSRKRIRGQRYLYAGRKIKGGRGQKQDVYLCPEKKLPEKSAQEIVSKLPV